MARLPRLYAPLIVQHVAQRPADGRALFVDDDDYALFTELLATAVREHALALHAYVLLPSQIRLLVTPKGAESIGRAMQSVGRHYVPHLNRKTGRIGPLWDRRYRSTLIDADAYLLAAMCSIEQKPVAEGHVAAPAQWRWSSHGHHIGREQHTIVSDHALYWALSDTPFERQALYRQLCDAPFDAAVAERIERAVERGWLLGDEAFVARIEGRLNRRGKPLQRGRPRKVATDLAPIKSGKIDRS
jgi:putative transposase